MIEQVRIPIRNCTKGYYLRWYYNGWHYWQFYNGTIEVLTKGEKYRTTAVRQVALSSGMVTEAQVEAIRTLLNSTEVYVYTDGGWAECRHAGGEVFVLKNYINAYEMQCKIIIGSRKISDTGYSVGVTKPYEYTPPEEDQGDLPSPEGICGLQVGTQIWACMNYDINYPGSKVYANNPAYRAIYGGLYFRDHFRAADFCPTGWHVPDNTEWSVLNNFVGGPEQQPGRHLRSVGRTYWERYTDETEGDDAFGFDLRGAPVYWESPQGWKFNTPKLSTILWSTTISGGDAYCCYTTYSANSLPVEKVWLHNAYLSVRLIKD
jgi:uncharacterized protein (TIGR02145 family)